MIDSAILDAMLAAGASAEVIVAAIKADAAGDDARREAKRAGNARRQRRYRDRLHGEDTRDLFEDDAGNASLTPGDATYAATGDIPPSLDKSPQTPKINPNPRACAEGAPAHEAPAPSPVRTSAIRPCPAGCDPNDWRDLLANRRAKRLAMTDAAYRKLIRDLAALTDDEWPPGRLLAHAAEKGWAQIFDPRDDREHQGNRRHGHRPASRSKTARPAGEPQNPLVRALLRSEAVGAGGDGPGF